MNEVKLTAIDIKLQTKDTIKETIIAWDSEQWETEIKTKSSLKMYTQYKGNIEEVDIYDNRPSSTILFGARTNTLQLNDRNRHRNKEIHCEACGNLEQKEDVYHFMLHCPAYFKERSTIQQLQQPYIEDKNQIPGKFLFEKAYIDKKKEELYQLWRARQRRLKTTRA